MIDMNKIKSLPVESRKKLVDYIEGLPASFGRVVKMNILDKDMDPSFFHSKTRNIHDYSTISRYLHKNTLHKVTNPNMCDYQKEYCQLMCAICDGNIFTPGIRNKLENILNAECYNIETLIKVEVFIGELFKEVENDREAMSNPNVINSLGYFITTKLIKYKCATFDFYSYLDVNDEIQLTPSDYQHMSRLNNMIVSLITSTSNITALHDMGSLIYNYIKDLGMESHIDKYNLFARFKYAMKNQNISDEDISVVEDRIMELATGKTNSTAATENLINTSKLGKVAGMNKDNIGTLDSSSDMSESNGYIFSFKSIRDHGADFLGEMAVKLSTLNPDEVLNYTSIAPENLTFDLNDNDIGHIRNENHMDIGTVYNSFNGEIRYIIEREGEFYLMFKDRMNGRVVYGVSVDKLTSTEEMDRPRKIITIKESANFGYKYIPEM